MPSFPSPVLGLLHSSRCHLILLSNRKLALCIANLSVSARRSTQGYVSAVISSSNLLSYLVFPRACIVESWHLVKLKSFAVHCPIPFAEIAAWIQELSLRAQYLSSIELLVTEPHELINPDVIYCRLGLCFPVTYCIPVVEN